ncbi:MAG: nucleotidyltransferase substrate binding protein [Desulfobacterales bacterium]|nr:nucleotidyltransferase substrate binding protein [Desulfobacterales bacterium]
MNNNNNNNNIDIRWKQRFQNFEKAFSQLKNAVTQLETLSDLEKEGMIQRFEYTFELAWKTLKDYLEENNVDAKFPREVIKQSFKYEIINDGDIWLEMLEQRNLMAHTYEEKIFKNTVNKISKTYFAAISQVYQYLKDK